MKSFRDEIFDICKRIQKSPQKELLGLLENITISKTKLDSDGKVIENSNDRSDFGYVSKSANNQFYGYLFANENINNYKKLFPKIDKLSDEETKIFQNAHVTITKLIDSCCNDLKLKTPKIAKIINPYYRYKPIEEVTGKPYLEDKDYDLAAEAFKNTDIYKRVVNSEVVSIFEKIDEKTLQQLFIVLEKNLISNPVDLISEDISELERKITIKHIEMTEVIMTYSILVLSLREMLQISCQLLYMALVGEDLIALTNDNIISIDKSTTNSLFHYYYVLVQDVIFSKYTNIVGDVVIMDCDPNERHHVHEFGVVRSTTISFDRDIGSSSKVGFITLDENLNPLHIISEFIMRNIS